MKKIFTVAKGDFKRIIKNPVALIIAIGICILPALYAWVNIKACWDPYATTSTIPIAIVNEDNGTNILGQDINIGNDVVKVLKQDTNIAWEFVTLDESKLGVVDGTYFASIEIPNDFSQDLVSVLSDNPKKSELTYRVDTKVNPVASKITGAATETVIDNITSNFIKTVNTEAFKKINGYSKDLDKNKDDIIMIKRGIVLASKNIDTLIDILESVNTNSVNLNTYLKNVNSTFPALTKSVSSASNTINDTESLINETNLAFNNSISVVKNSLIEIKNNLNRIIEILNSISTTDNSKSINKKLYSITNNIRLIDTNYTAVISFLDNINKLKPNQTLSNVIVALKSNQSTLTSEINFLKDIISKTSSGNEILIDDITTLKDKLLKISNNIDITINNFDSNITPAFNDLTNYLIDALKNASEILNTSQKSPDQVLMLLDNAQEATNLTSEISDNLLFNLKSYRNEIKYIGSKLSNIDDNNLSTILSVLQSNPDLMGEFISNPFNIKEVKVYEVPNYGSSMAPIYSVLALWVGGLILTSIFKTEVSKEANLNNLSINEKCYGKLITFIIFACIQGFIISIGNIFLLNIYCVNPFLMILFSILSSATFITIIYTNVSLLGNFGKAINIILMIIQLAGCGGSYPIQLDPVFFRVLQPIFPFTYAVGGFREAIAGPLASSVILDIVILIFYIAIYLLLCYFFKPKLHYAIKDFETKFKESGISE